MPLVRKSRKLHYNCLDETKLLIVFWKTIKPFSSYKIVPREKLALIEKDEISESDFDTAQITNTFFSKIASTDNISNPFMKSIVKCRNQPSRGRGIHRGIPQATSLLCLFPFHIQIENKCKKKRQKPWKET